MSGSWASGTGRVVLKVNGQAFSAWTGMTITRDLGDITGKFSLQYYDAGRAVAAMPGVPHAAPVPSPILRRQACTVALDSETVITGWIDGMEGEWTDTSLQTSVTGRDKTGDLADCAAAPTGPAEWRGVTLLQVAQQICAPFGIAVRAETDMGAPFARLALNPHETALSLLEKAARQRAVLVVSDGIGGLLLTTGGRTRAPADIRVGANAQRVKFHFDDARRFSDYYVKGQTERAAGARAGKGPPLGHDAVPVPTFSPLPASAKAVEAGGIQMTGHAVDKEVTRWRPSVVMTRTQSGASTCQQQAEWKARVARGLSTGLTYTVLDWRAGAGHALWKPNTVARVFDPWAGIDDDMLIRGVCYRITDKGILTDLSIVGVTAFDRIDEAATKKPLRPAQAASRR
jgi:prophage tail gpP-like protein